MALSTTRRLAAGCMALVAAFGTAAFGPAIDPAFAEVNLFPIPDRLPAKYFADARELTGRTIVLTDEWGRLPLTLRHNGILEAALDGRTIRGNWTVDDRGYLCLEADEQIFVGGICWVLLGRSADRVEGMITLAKPDSYYPLQILDGAR